MTVNEASEKYHIPVEILKEYESWGLCGEVKMVMGVWQYNDQDLQRLGMIMTLHEIGFSNEEVEAYMRLFLKGDSTEKERLEMLKKKRGKVLDEIHFKEKQLDCMDYLRYKITKAQKKFNSNI
ncbi:MerR family transcriptional regulator [Enterocloster lavalensis]|uniref:MerR family transcriptional regulator n=1 Tax=Enterocloster lavalensis TaxID=460384 RepID=UPI001D074037|nr:MerR family transcriptional regulator [Enterocloster lavalensis]MCB6345450.1 MerR family transcriptional regulator [Enterocloster lavalensis]